VQNIENMVGLKLKQLQTDCEETLCYQGLRFGFGKTVTPMYEVVDEQAEILGTYAGNGKTAIAQRGDNVYIAAGNVPYPLWQGLAKRAGVHIYCEKGGALYTDSRFVARQTVHETACEIHMPFDAEMEEMFDGGRYRTSHGVLRYNAEAGSTKLFRIVNNASQK
ncbi:MAG TPA: hypothetical protein VHR86_06690, partial [Armatimonadota bacterium]|nr:hypothetical protein [Armatimonadota bacterium]